MKKFHPTKKDEAKARQIARRFLKKQKMKITKGG